MQRRLINIGAAGSLALCVVVCALWVRSHFVAVEVSIWEGDFRAGNLCSCSACVARLACHTLAAKAMTSEGATAVLAANASLFRRTSVWKR